MIVIEHDGIVAPEYIFFLLPHLHICCKPNIKCSNLEDLIESNIFQIEGKKGKELDVFIATY